MIAPDAWLNHLVEQLSRVHEGTDPEAVHQLRVAAGRLSVWLELGERRILRDDLRTLRRSASQVRDLDVLLDGVVPSDRGDLFAGASDSARGADSTRVAETDWASALRDERAVRARELAARMSMPRIEALLFGLSISAPVDEETARRGVSKLEQRMLAAGDRLERRVLDAGDPLERRVRDAGDPSAQQERIAIALHRLRRAVRRLRYAHEWLGQEAAELKHLQDELGSVNDLVVRIRHIDESATRPALEPLRSETEGEIRTGTERAIEAWRKIESQIRS